MGVLSTTSEARAYPYRVFISYSHSDREIVQNLVHVLNSVGVSPMWDNDLLPGTGFSEQIQSFIRNSHVFLPVLTEASAQQPWLHQEIGFAIALGKPILPVVLGVLPAGFISPIQAVTLRGDLSDASARLSGAVFHTLMAPLKEHPVTYECTDDNVRRALLLASYAESIIAIGQRGLVRQMASLTTFHLPDRGGADPIWKEYFPRTPGDRLLFDALQKERIALRKHAQDRGCRLILDPVDHIERVYRRYGPTSILPRVKGLLSFLCDESIADIVVAFNDDRERNVSITLVGDWFSSEAVSSGGRSLLRESVFTRCASVVLQQIEDFDHRIQDLLAHKGWTPESSRPNVVSDLQAYLARKS